MASSMDTQTTTHQPDSEPKTQGGRAARPAASVDQRINRLSTASLKRIIEPDTEVPGEIGDGQVLPDELVSFRTSPSSSPA